MRVLATRPEKQNAAWIKLLQQLGLNPITCPLVVIRQVSGATLEQLIKNKILALDQYYALIFVSQNAVKFGLEWVDDFWPQLPVGVQWFAVGVKTAKCLNAHPLLMGEHISAATGQMNSEELLQDKGLQKGVVSGQKILIFRGVGGRTMLGDSLRKRGAEVDYCELYHRVAPEASSLPATFDFNLNELIVPVFSNEALQNFYNLFRPDSGSLKTANLVVPGKRVFDFARELGFETIEMAVNASEQAMLNAIKKAVKN